MSSAPDENLTIDFMSKVGGFLGFGTSQCDAKIRFNQNHFFAGSKIDASLDVDNSKVGAAVDFIQLSLV
jgi:hypothetical protein